MSRTIYKTYFSHDIYARQDRKIKNLLIHFRKESEDKAKAALCIYWWIIEDMHQDDYKANDLAMYADDYRCDVETLKIILNNFELFRLDGDFYISDRVLRNIAEQEEKSKKAKKSASNRWRQDDVEQKKPTEPNISPDDVFVGEVLQCYSKISGDTKIVSKENKKIIAKISEENTLKLEDWQKIFTNAKRGWDYPDGKHVTPSLKKILEDWDSFHRGDNGLAPAPVDKEAIEKRKQEEKEAGKLLDSSLDTEFFVYDDYRCSNNIKKLEAQRIFTETNKTDSEENSIKKMIIFLRGDSNDEI